MKALTMWLIIVVELISGTNSYMLVNIILLYCVIASYAK